MVNERWSNEQLNGFHSAAQSLKLYRRAELQNEGDGSSSVEELYVDPLPNDHVLQTMMKSNTTFLIGRKGTGKSTVFQRSQHELRKNSSYASAYIDIKTVFESSQVDSTLSAKLDGMSDALSKGSLEKLLLYRTFLRDVIDQIREELKNRVQRTRWERFRDRFSGSTEEFFEGLDALLEEASDDEFISVLSLKHPNVSSAHETSEESGNTTGIGLSVGATPAVNASVADSDSTGSRVIEGRQYVDILMRTFNITELLNRLNKLLQTIGVRHLYIFVDDFSELPEDAMHIVVDTILAPLNNWSNEVIKFKVAAYPGRIYYGDIDKTKIDEINLDLFKLYGSTEVSTMEEKAIDFTYRLLERRVKYYCNSDPSLFIDSKDEETWRVLFYATIANPRILGYILFYLYESHLIYGRSIGQNAIRDAARKYYEEKLESYFELNKFQHEDFHERSSVFSLKELLETLVSRARELRGHRGSAVMREIEGRPPTSHFHIVTELEHLLSTLELNFFLTKYFEMSDRDGRKVSVFALNYGLCQKYTIEFGRPSGKREHRLYFVERIFDYSPVLNKYMRMNQEIVCNQCKEKFDLEQLPALSLYGMMCPRCKQGYCAVINLSKKYEETINSIAHELLLPGTELGILHTLHTEKDPLYASNIAGELDCSYQLVGKRGKFLAQRGLVNRDNYDQNRRLFEITALAEKSYFQESPRDLDLE